MRNMRNECLIAALDELAKVGIRDVVQAHGSKHLQLRWRTNGHGERFYAVPGSASDHRSHLNVRADIRRMLRADGLIAEQPSKPSPPVVKAKTPDRISLIEMRLRAVELELEKLKKHHFSE
jgi:hypothetical protein